MKEFTPGRALVLFSGGQDSTTALLYALNSYDHVETVGFHYGQRHDVELACRLAIFKRIGDLFPALAAKLGPDHTLDLTTFSNLTNSALTDETARFVTGDHGLPTSFVPGRNLFFFHYAAVIGYNRDLGKLVGGMCETDYSGYPDCRHETLTSLNETLKLGMAADFEIVTPLMFLTKAAIWQMADSLGGDAALSLIREETHTCYKGVRETLYEWGYGCASCPACVIRAKGYEAFQGLLAKG